MKWIRATHALPESPEPVIVEPVFGYFLAVYVSPQSVIIEDFYNKSLNCYDEEYARDYVREGWYVCCYYGYYPYWPLSCVILRWAVVRESDPSLHWIDCRKRQPAALETVLARTHARDYCALYVPPQTVTIHDFIRFDPEIEYRHEAWEYSGNGNPCYLKAGWHIPVYCEGGKKMSLPLHGLPSHWAYIPKITGKHERAFRPQGDSV